MEIFLSIILLTIVAVCVRAVYENSHYEIEYKDIIDERVHNDFKIVFFADLHNTVYGKNNEKLLANIKAFSPDFIIIAGDAFVAKKNEKNIKAVHFIQELCRENELIYTFGNHETKLRNAEKYRYTLNELDKIEYSENLKILNNSSYLKNVNGTKINIIGYEADLKFYKKFKGVNPDVKDIIKVAGEKENNGDICFVLAHNPDFFEAYVEYGADYIFSGHNHGGIVRLPFIGGLISTGYRMFPKYYGGEYQKGKTTMFVTRGLGSHTIRFRLFNLPQVHMFTFKNN